MRRTIRAGVPLLVALSYLICAFVAITGAVRRKEGDDPPIMPAVEGLGYWLIRFPIGYLVDSYLINNILVLPLLHAVMGAVWRI